MKIQTEDIGTNKKTDRFRVVLLTACAVPLIIFSECQLLSSSALTPEAAPSWFSDFYLNPRLLIAAGAAAVGIMGALKFIGKSMDSVDQATTIDEMPSGLLSSEQDIKHEIEKHSSKEVKPPPTKTTEAVIQPRRPGSAESGLSLSFHLSNEVGFRAALLTTFI